MIYRPLGCHLPRFWVCYRASRSCGACRNRCSSTQGYQHTAPCMSPLCPTRQVLQWERDQGLGCRGRASILYSFLCMVKLQIVQTKHTGDRKKGPRTESPGLRLTRIRVKVRVEVRFLESFQVIQQDHRSINFAGVNEKTRTRR